MNLLTRNWQTPNFFTLRPLASSLRTVLFSWLNDLRGKIGLDAFGGSGALSLGLLSKGPQSVSTVESNFTIFRVFRNFAKHFLKKELVAVCSDVFKTIPTNPRAYDIILLDPPFTIEGIVFNALRLATQKIGGRGCIILRTNAAPPSFFRILECLGLQIIRKGQVSACWLCIISIRNQHQASINVSGLNSI